jgi:hypothetical protein
LLISSEVAVKVFRTGYVQREFFREYFMTEAEKVTLSQRIFLSQQIAECFYLILGLFGDVMRASNRSHRLVGILLNMLHQNNHWE